MNALEGTREWIIGKGEVLQIPVHPFQMSEWMSELGEEQVSKRGKECKNFMMN